MQNLRTELFEILDLETGKEEAKVLDSQFQIFEEVLAAGDYMAARFVGLRLKLLREDLLIVREKNSDAFNKLCRELRNSRDNDGFFGHRFELRIAASLISKEVEFRKSESPDFTIVQNSPVFLECTSLRSRGSPIGKKQFLKKLVDAISAKEGKEYAKTDCALLIDQTNLYYNLSPDAWQEIHDEFSADVMRWADEEKFGSVLLFLVSYSQRDSFLRYTFNRVDSPSVSLHLMTFLDAKYPLGSTSIRGPAVPREGV